MMQIPEEIIAELHVQDEFEDLIINPKLPKKIKFSKPKSRRN
jgi:hypothetical protein